MLFMTKKKTESKINVNKKDWPTKWVCSSPKEYFQSLEKVTELYKERILFSFTNKKCISP